MLATIKGFIIEYAAILALIVALAGWTACGVQTVRFDRSEKDVATLRSAWDTELLRQAKTAQETGEKYRVEEARRNDAINKAVQDEAIKTKSAQADAVSAGDALERLRKRVAAASCGATSGNTIAASSGVAATAPVDMQSDVLGRVGEAAGQLAFAADQARIAGQACEQSYNSLISK